MALSPVLACTAQGNTVVDQHIVADLRGLADDNPHTVVNDQPAADLGPGVNLDAGTPAVPLGFQPRQKKQFVPVEKMGNPVADDGVDAGIEQENLQFAPSGRIPGLVGR